MNIQILALAIQTFLVWLIVIFLHRQKEKFTLLPLYSLISVLTLLTHNLSDLGFAVIFGQFYFLIASVSFFTSLMLSVLFLYLFDGPRATRIALIIIVLTSGFYAAIVGMLGLQADTSKWVALTSEHFMGYFWSVLAITIDVFFLAIAWEYLGRVKWLPNSLRVFAVIIGVYFLDSLIFVTGAFGSSPLYLSILQGGFATRLVLALIITPIIAFYLKSENFNEENRDKPKNSWEILNFKSDLEQKIKSMESYINELNALQKELNQSKETYSLAIEGANAGIWDWDIIINNVTYSKKFTELLGYQENELPKKVEGLQSYVHSDDLQRIIESYSKISASSNTFSVECRLKMKDGNFKWFLGGGIVRYNQEGNPIRMVGSIINIDDKKQLQKTLEEKVKELEHLNKFMVDREVKMTELKQELSKLKSTT